MHSNLFVKGPAVDLRATLHRPAPFDDEAWRVSIITGFNPRVHGPYDMLFQVLRSSVQGRTLDIESIKRENLEPTPDSWWHQATLRGRSPF